MTTPENIKLPETTFGDGLVDFLANHLLGVKTAAVADWPGGEGAPDLLPAIAPIRGTELVGWVLARQVDRDLALEAAHKSIIGFGADMVVMGLDSRTSVQPWTKEQMDEMKKGDLQRMAEEEGSDLLGITVECIVIQAISNNGRVRMGIFPYVVHKEDDGVTHHIEWLEETNYFDSDKDDGAVEGVVVETVLHSFEQAKEVPDLLMGLGVGAFGLEAEQARAHLDCAIIRVLMDENFAVLYNAETEVKREVLQRSTEEGVLSGAHAELRGEGTYDVDDSD